MVIHASTSSSTYIFPASAELDLWFYQSCYDVHIYIKKKKKKKNLEEIFFLPLVSPDVVVNGVP